MERDENVTVTRATKKTSSNLVWFLYSLFFIVCFAKVITHHGSSGLVSIRLRDKITHTPLSVNILYVK